MAKRKPKATNADEPGGSPPTLSVDADAVVDTDAVLQLTPMGWACVVSALFPAAHALAEKLLSAAGATSALSQGEIRRLWEAETASLYEAAACKRGAPASTTQTDSPAESQLQTSTAATAVPSQAPTQTPAFVLTEDQAAAWEKLRAWALQPDRPFFVLAGYAGTGKTTLMRMLATLENVTFVYTAPTNKAARVLARALSTSASTTYSALKLRLVEDYDVDPPEIRIEPSEDPLQYAPGTVLVVDEASMVNEELRDAILSACEQYAMRVLFVGDPAQLPPINEDQSSVWKLAQAPEDRAFLHTVCRFDNHILTLCTRLRNEVRSQLPAGRVSLEPGPGVSVLTASRFVSSALTGASAETFQDRKFIAWRNARVSELNEAVRGHLGFSGEPYVKGDLLMFARPFTPNGTPLATIDDEVIVEDVTEDVVSVPSPWASSRAVTTIDVYRLQVRGDFTGSVLIPQSRGQYDDVLSKWAGHIRGARLSPLDKKDAWTAFYAFRNRFTDFRYAYAITAHRAQGSTYAEAWVDTQDILGNRHRKTALRCLYVACSRPTTSLHLL